MRLPDTSLYTIVQLVMGGAMGIGGVALLFGVFVINTVPDKAMIALCLLAIAGKYLADGLIQLMSAMSMNVEPEPELTAEMIH
jgi:hypothetical protein